MDEGEEKDEGPKGVNPSENTVAGSEKSGGTDVVESTPRSPSNEGEGAGEQENDSPDEAV